MNEQLKELLNTLYEAEGLVEMALRRSARPDGRIVRLVCEKCFLTARLASEIELPEEEDCVENVAPPLYGNSEPAVEADDRDTEEEKEVEVFTKEILSRMSGEEERKDILDGSIFVGQETREEGSAVCDCEDYDMPVEEEETYKGKADMSPVVAGPLKAPAGRRACRKPVMACFSINDKFRFRRELFSGSDAMFRDSLAFFEAMEGLPEARSYMFNDLGWNPESPDVKSFISILDRYYR